MEIVILAGGMGTRLRPHIEDIPKCMVPVNGRPLLDYQLSWLKQYSIGKTVLACGYKWEEIKKHYGDAFVYSAEEEPLGTAGALKLALEHIEGEEFLVVNADDINDVDLTALWKMGSNTTVVSMFHSRFGIAEFDNGKIKRFREKPLLPYWANIGLHMLNKTVKLPNNGSLEKGILPQLAEKGQLKAYKHQGFWMTVNTVKDLEELEAALRENRKPVIMDS